MGPWRTKKVAAHTANQLVIAWSAGRPAPGVCKHSKLERPDGLTTSRTGETQCNDVLIIINNNNSPVTL